MSSLEEDQISDNHPESSFNHQGEYKGGSKAVKAAQSIVGVSAGRFEDDFYRTPENATLALLSVEKFPLNIWEPACGDGAISKVLVENGYRNNVISTDLYDKGYGEPGKDFFQFSSAPKYCLTPDKFGFVQCDHVEECRSIVTNPPYQFKSGSKTYRVEDWVEKAFQFENIDKVALLLKTTAIAGQERSKIFQRCGLSSMLQFRGRLKMARQGEKKDTSCMIDFAWFVFNRGYVGDPVIKWI